MKKRYKIKETNKTKLKSYLKSKLKNNTNERNTRYSTSRVS
jgi:hypothetical protein